MCVGAVNGAGRSVDQMFHAVVAAALENVESSGDVAVDGAEAVIVPVLVATLLMPYLAPKSIVQELRAEHATRV